MQHTHPNHILLQNEQYTADCDEEIFCHWSWLGILLKSVALSHEKVVKPTRDREMAAPKKSARRVKGSPFFNAIHVNRGKKIDALKARKPSVKRERSSPRLYMKATLAGFRRGLSHQRKDTALLRIENVTTGNDADWYVGKRCCFVYHGYKAKRCVRWSKARARRGNTRATWGRVTKAHGSAGTVRAKFTSALPGQAIGRRVRVYLYPSRV